MHRTLNSLLGKVVSSRQTDWDKHLPYVVVALRASCSESTGYSANFLMLDREVNTPTDIVYGLKNPEPVMSYDDFVESVKEKMKIAFEVVRDNLGVAAECNKRYYDLRAKSSLSTVCLLLQHSETCWTFRQVAQEVHWSFPSGESVVSSECVVAEIQEVATIRCPCG